MEEGLRSCLLFSQGNGHQGREPTTCQTNYHQPWPQNNCERDGTCDISMAFSVEGEVLSKIFFVFDVSLYMPPIGLKSGY